MKFNYSAGRRYNFTVLVTTPKHLLGKNPTAEMQKRIEDVGGFFNVQVIDFSDLGDGKLRIPGRNIVQSPLEWMANVTVDVAQNQSVDLETVGMRMFEITENGPAQPRYNDFQKGSKLRIFTPQFEVYNEWKFVPGLAAAFVVAAGPFFLASRILRKITEKLAA